MGLSPSRHSVNTVSVRSSNSVPCGLGAHLGRPHLGRRLPERLHRAAPYSEGAGGCALHRPAQARCTSGTGCTQQQAGLVAPCFKVLHRAYPWARARKRSPSHGMPGAQPTLAQAPAFSEHGLETDAINKGFFTVHSAMGRRPPLCFTVHSVMGRRPTLSTQ